MVSELRGMTVKEAKAVLKVRLRFGDVKQIHAVKMVALVQQILSDPNAEIEKDCSECDGDGTHSCTCGHEHTCEECDGTGKTSRTYKYFDLEGMTAAELAEIVADIEAMEVA